MKYILTSLFIIPFFFSSFVFAAGNKHHRPGHHQKGQILKILEELNLTEEQSNSIKELNKKNKVAIKNLKKTKKQKKEALEKAFKNKGSDDELIRLHNELVDARTHLMKKRFQHHMDISRLLTGKQKAQFRKAIRSKFKHHENR